MNTAGLDTCSPRCGDGRRIGSEGCDDGNAISGDGCSSQCIVEVNVKKSKTDFADWGWFSVRWWFVDISGCLHQVWRWPTFWNRKL